MGLSIHNVQDCKITVDNLIADEKASDLKKLTKFVHLLIVAKICSIPITVNDVEDSFT